MKNLTIENIALACEGKVYGAAGLTEDMMAREATAVVLDSRLLTPGAVFIATRGERVDGHRFISQVFVQGAMAVICEELPDPLTGPCVLVKDSFQALKDLARYYRSQLDIRVIGITGSVGKTSTKEFIAGVLSAKYRVWKTQGNFNNEVGLPLTVLQLRQEHQVAILEMGINQFGEMHRLSEIARPDICVFTNIGECHLEFLKDRDGVLSAKSEILDFWNPDGYICINGDDDKLITLKEKWGDRVISFGRNRENDYYTLSEISGGLLGSTISTGGKVEMNGVDVPLPGEHMVLNALAATAVGDIMGLDKEQIIRGMGLVETVAGRSNIIKIGKYVLIDDCYNANPVSMKAALDLLQEVRGRRVAILGDMFELGEKEAAMHKEVGAYGANGKADLLIFVGKLSKFMYEGALDCQDKAEEKKGSPGTPMNVEICYAQEKEKLYPLLKEKIMPEDTILLKASHGMGFAEVIDWLKENLD